MQQLTRFDLVACDPSRLPAQSASVSCKHQYLVHACRTPHVRHSGLFKACVRSQCVSTSPCPHASPGAYDQVRPIHSVHDMRVLVLMAARVNCWHYPKGIDQVMWVGRRLASHVCDVSQCEQARPETRRCAAGLAVAYGVGRWPFAACKMRYGAKRAYVHVTLAAHSGRLQVDCRRAWNVGAPTAR